MVITPFCDTFSIASAIREPMTSSPEEIAPTRVISPEPETGWEFLRIAPTAASVALVMPRFMVMGFAPAARFLRPSFIIACASTVALVVPSPATSFVLVETSLIS